MAKMGRPKIEIDWELLEKLCEIHCTQSEIEAIMKVSMNTLERAIRKKHDLTFGQFSRQKASVGKMSLRRAQYSGAISGNVPLLIWLGKQWLGQSEKIEHTEEVKNKYEEPDSLTDDKPSN